MINIYNNIEKYNANKEQKILIVFDDMITDMLSNKRLNLIVTELFIRGGKLKAYLVSGHCFIIKISNKQKLQQIAFNHSSDVEFKDFMNVCKKYTAQPYFFQLLLLLLHQIILSFQKESFRRNIKINHDS